MTDGVDALTYHAETVHTPASVRAGHRLDFENKPRPSKVYEDLPRRSLPGFCPPRQPTLAVIATPTPDGDPRWGSVDAAFLANCCYHSGGITKRIRRGDRELLFRAAACTGALYHVDLYLVAGECGDLSAGVYHYDPTSHAVTVLREGDHRGTLAAATGNHAAVAEAPCSIVATSTWWRNAWKYRERTYRHAFWDAGTVLANVLATSHALDRRANVVLGFADAPVAELVGVEPSREAPLAVVPLGQGETVPSPTEPASLDPATRPLSPEEREYALITEAYTASSLPDGDAAAAWRDPPATNVGRRDHEGGSRVPLEPAEADELERSPLDDTVHRRGSCREYRRDPLPARTLATVLDRATRGVPIDVVGNEAPPLAFADAYVAVHAVAGIEPGLYHYHPEPGELERLATGEFRRECGHATLDQRLGADAAAVVFFLADLEQVVERYGDRGYRVAQFEAAATAGRCYLAAYAHADVGATGLTFYDEVVTDLFSPRAAGQAPLFCWTVGRPA